MKLRNKIFCIFLLLSIMPIVIITLYTYNRYVTLVQEQILQVGNNIFEKAEDECNYRIKDIELIPNIFQTRSPTNNSLADDMKKYTVSGDYSYYDIMITNNTFKFMCQNLFLSTDYINGIFFFTPSGVNFGYAVGRNIDVRADYLPFNDKWYQDTLENEGTVRVGEVGTADFLLHAQDSIQFSKAVYDAYTMKFLGVVLIDCSPTVFDLSSVNPLPETVALAVENDKGRILYSNVNDIKTFLIEDSVTMKTSLDIESLTLASTLNFKQLYQQFGVTRVMILIISFVCALTFAVLSVFLSYYITKPITFLSQRMVDQTIQNTALENKYADRMDEIGILYNRYHAMLLDLQKYIRDNYQNKLITLDSQMRSLEAQINSHFLYNTLESINSIAALEEIESISTMSQALGKMLHYSIKTQSELVPLADELRHVENYVSIQQIRFDNRFRLELNIPSELYEQRVLKLILQPIVENALIHGLRYCKNGDLIRITASQQNGNMLLFRISNNGIGITPEKLAELKCVLNKETTFTELGRRTSQSIGLKNIHTRIALYYGQGYGLSINENIDQTDEITEILIRIPTS